MGALEKDSSHHCAEEGSAPRENLASNVFFLFNRRPHIKIQLIWKIKWPKSHLGWSALSRYADFAPFGQLLAAYSTLDFTRSSRAGKGTRHLLPTTPDMK